MVNKQQTIKEYADELVGTSYGSKAALARMINKARQQVDRWVKVNGLVIDHKIYTPSQGHFNEVTTINGKPYKMVFDVAGYLP